MKNIESYDFISKLKSLPFIDEIWLFGSRARGENRERSDIDLAIICPTAKDQDWLDVLDVIEEADTLFKIDCVRCEKERIGDELYKNILDDKKVIYINHRNTA